jgi:hypothetical protein
MEATGGRPNGSKTQPRPPLRVGLPVRAPRWGHALTTVSDTTRQSRCINGGVPLVAKRAVLATVELESDCAHGDASRCARCSFLTQSLVGTRRKKRSISQSARR